MSHHQIRRFDDFPPVISAEAKRLARSNGHYVVESTCDRCTCGNTTWVFSDRGGRFLVGISGQCFPAGGECRRLNIANRRQASYNREIEEENKRLIQEVASAEGYALRRVEGVRKELWECQENAAVAARSLAKCASDLDSLRKTVPLLPSPVRVDQPPGHVRPGEATTSSAAATDGAVDAAADAILQCQKELEINADSVRELHEQLKAKESQVKKYASDKAFCENSWRICEAERCKYKPGCKPHTHQINDERGFFTPRGTGVRREIGGELDEIPWSYGPDFSQGPHPPVRGAEEDDRGHGPAPGAAAEGEDRERASDEDDGMSNFLFISHLSHFLIVFIFAAFEHLISFLSNCFAAFERLLSFPLSHFRFVSVL